MVNRSARRLGFRVQSSTPIRRRARQRGSQSLSIPHIVMVEDNLPDVMVFREAVARRGIAFTIEHFADGERPRAPSRRCARDPIFSFST